jgi:predicted MPP superfamily phosphohydrolase
VFAVLGNHDDDREVPRALAARGIAVLKDARTRVVIRGDALELVGIGFWTRRVVALTRLLEGASGATILLAHDPRRFYDAAALNIGVVLSGHTHGGQVVLPGVGAPVRSRFPILHGTARRHNTSLFVSRGVGTVYLPVRINCPPEVAVVTLRRRSAI